MPIIGAGGRRGSGGTIARPGGASSLSGTWGIGRGQRPGANRQGLSPGGFSLNPSSRPFRSRPLSDYISARITGTTLDSAGSPLGSCVVDMFRTSDDIKVDSTTSDGSGVFSFIPLQYGPFYLVAYKPGSPDVAGTTVNTLVGE